jgi:ketosteroid isomerase-like protein
MKKNLLFLIFILLSCLDSNSIEKYKGEVLQRERAFAQMAKDEGIEKAFLYFAADSAVLNRNDKIYKGPDQFKKYFSNPIWKRARLQWQPDYIDVSKSGDLAYTYGRYTFSVTDSSGQETSSRGIFHTVWKRQEDGSWKFVWD